MKFCILQDQKLNQKIGIYDCSEYATFGIKNDLLNNFKGSNFLYEFENKEFLVRIVYWYYALNNKYFE